MATLQAATTSNGAVVTNIEAVCQLCERYRFGLLDWEVTDEAVFRLCGYDDFEVYSARSNGLPDYEDGIKTHDFLRSMADYLESGEELDIQTVGYTKCRFPVLAKRYIVREDAVLHADLSGFEPIDE